MPTAFVKMCFVFSGWGCCSLAILAGFGTVLQSAEPASIVQPLPRIAAVAPAEAAQTIKLQNGFRAELIAAEPLVTDPVAMVYDENGRAYVVEMNDYPYSDKSHDHAWQEQTSKPIGRIRLLQDTNADGLFDTATVFADKLSWPAGLALWKGGLFVAATPDIWYLKDTTGDGRADIKRKVFTGFRKYNVQAVMNNFRWGLDHHIYAAGASNGGNLSAATAPETKPVRLGRADIKIDPRTEAFELVSGGARFGNTFDDWGNRFLCTIRNPVQHIVLSARYLKRNPYLPVASALNDVAKSGDAIAVFQISPPEPWRVMNAERLAANTATKSPHDSTVPSGFITSSSGVTIYRGAAYGPDYLGDAFIGEVAGNLVMRYKLTADGVSFQGVRAHENVEFLASTDHWFRPVNFVNAPDGTLHVLDMYRETIEHPWSMPDDLKARVDLTSGRDRGRIYRLAPPKYPASFQKPPQPRLGNASTATLVAELENPNSWWRDTAHRLLFERQDRAAETPLRKLLHASTQPLARLHALWSLEGLGVLTNDDLLAALNDANAHLREHAVRLSEPRLNAQPKLLREVLAAAEDDNSRVRFQVAFSLGAVKNQQAIKALAKIARRDGENRWIRTAILSSLADNAAPFLLDLLADQQFASSPPGRAIIGPLMAVVGARNNQHDITAVLDKLAQRESTSAEQRRLRHTAILQLGSGLKRARQDLTPWINEAGSPGGRMLNRMFAAAGKTAIDESAALASRLAAIELLAFGERQAALETLPPLLASRNPQSIQTAVIVTLTSFPQPEVADLLLEKYPALTPAVRADVVAKLLTRQAWVVRLLDAIAEKTVAANRVSSVRQAIYMKSSYAPIRERALKIFTVETPGLRQEVIAAYQTALSRIPADASQGEKIFKRECMNCHRVGGQGYDVGPNLATVKNRTAAQLLVHVLDPNREVSPNYFEYILATDDGRVITGVITSETAAGITLRQPENKTETILRANIEEIRSSGKSAMPEGLEKKISPQEMADLLAFLLSSPNQ